MTRVFLTLLTILLIVAAGAYGVYWKVVHDRALTLLDSDTSVFESNRGGYAAALRVLRAIDPAAAQRTKKRAYVVVLDGPTSEP